ncbi:MAG: hypothetical protein U0841_22770 [Chloroflexia bacterium]
MRRFGRHRHGASNVAASADGIRHARQPDGGRAVAQARVAARHACDANGVIHARGGAGDDAADSHYQKWRCNDQH